MSTPNQTTLNVSISDLNEQSLSTLDEYLALLHRRVRMLGLSLGKTSRMSQLLGMFVQATAMVRIVD